MNNHPSKFWTWLFKKLCNDSFYEELQGDLEEKFFINLENKGANKAKAIYRKEVIKMIRPSVMALNKRLSILISLSIFKIHFVLAIRNMVRNKVFSAVNIFGLGAAIAVCLFMVNMISTGYTLDTQHKGSDRIYRIANFVERDIGNMLYASSSFPLSDKVRETIPDFEVVTHINSSFRSKFKVNEVDVPIEGVFVDKHFFDLFSFNAVKGNPLDIFDDINSMIVTDDLAERLFPDENPIGKITQEGFVIRAVIESPKGKSHIQFKTLSSMDVYNAREPNAINSWKYFYQDYTYVKLKAGLDPNTTKNKLTTLSNQVSALPEVVPTTYNFLLQPISKIVLGDLSMNDFSSGIGSETVYVFSILIFLMMFIASFNYTNLSIARAIQRTKEVGIRKVVGSTRWQIVSQFLLETIIFSIIGLIIGFIIYSYFSDSFVETIPEFSVIFSTQLSLEIILLFLTFALFSGLLAGLFPALFFSRITPLSLFNSRIKTKKLSFQTLRKILVGFQLTLSMFVLLFVNLIVEQYQTLKSMPLGFEPEGLIVIKPVERNYDIVLDELGKIAEVEGITLTSGLPGVSSNGVMMFTDTVTNDSTIMINFLMADANFDDVFNPEISLGSFYNRMSTTPYEREIVVNEEFIQVLNLDRTNIIGHTISKDSINFKIVGVLEKLVGNDPLQQKRKATMIVNLTPLFNTWFVLKVQDQNLTTALTKLENGWNKIHPENRFQPTLYRDHYQASFNDLNNIIKVLSFLGACIILISLLGQLGMALYNAETRVKEIGIRKVLGAKIKSIMSLLLKNTLITIVIAVLIATPLAYQFFQVSFMGEVNSTLDLTPLLFLRAILAFTLLLVGVVVTLTWRAASLNPSESLRNE